MKCDLGQQHSSGWHWRGDITIQNRIVSNYTFKAIEKLSTAHCTKINFSVNLLKNIFGHEFWFPFSPMIFASRETFMQNIFSLPSTLSQKNPFSWFIFISKLLVKFRSWTVISCHRRFQCLVIKDHLRISKSIDSRPISTHKWLKMSSKLLLQVYLCKNISISQLIAR